MSNTVAHIVRQRADREGKLVGCLGALKELLHEIPRADIMCQIREEPVCKGIIPEVLNDAAAIRVRMCLSQLLGRERRKTV